MCKRARVAGTGSEVSELIFGNLTHCTTHICSSVFIKQFRQFFICYVAQPKLRLSQCCCWSLLGSQMKLIELDHQESSSNIIHRPKGADNGRSPCKKKTACQTEIFVRHIFWTAHIRFTGREYDEFCLWQ